MTDWVSTKRAMQLLGVSSTTIKRWADNGTLPSMRTAGGHRRFRRDDVERLTQRQPAAGQIPVADEWIDLLTEVSDVEVIRGEIYRLRHQLGDWHRTAEFLDNLMGEIWNRRSDDDQPDAASVIAAGRLGLARTTIGGEGTFGDTNTKHVI